MTQKYESIPIDNKPNFKLHTGEEYFDTLVADIDAQNEGFMSASTMGFDPTDQRVKKTLTAMYNAAQRGINVSLTVDNFAFLDQHRVGPFGDLSGGGIDFFDNLAGQDAHIFTGASNYPTIAGRFQNVFHSPVYMGRSHIKSATVGDNLYAGGISFDATDRLDMMTSVEHPGLALWLTRLNRMSIIKPSVAAVLQGQDHIVSFHDDTMSQLMVDAGVRGQSAILDEALAMIDGAEERLVYSSEQFPMGKVGDRLLSAFERGVDVTIASNNPDKHDRYTAIHKAILAIAKKKYPSEFFEHQLPVEFTVLHTKALASESRAMVGSHNLNQIGVMLGTAEIEIVSSDKDFVKQVGGLVLRQINLGPDA